MQQTHLALLAAAEETHTELPIAPIWIGVGTFVILLILLIVVLALGKGRPHS